MKAFNGDPDKKREFVEAAAWHEEQDLYYRGSYGFRTDHEDSSPTKFRGCSVGCTIASAHMMELGIDYKNPQQASTYWSRITELDNWDHGDHHVLANILNVPRWLIDMQENIFESAGDDEDAMRWTRQFLESIPVGFDDWQLVAEAMVDETINLYSKYDSKRACELQKEKEEIFSIHNSTSLDAALFWLMQRNMFAQQTKEIFLRVMDTINKELDNAGIQR